MATTSEWTAFASATTDAETTGDVPPSEWTAWSSATTFTSEQTEWWLAGDLSWIPAALRTWVVTALSSAVADAADISQFGDTVGDELTLTFDGALDDTDTTSPEVQFGSALAIPCSSSAVSCVIAGSTLTVTATSEFLSSRDLSADTVVAVDGLADASGAAVVVDSPVAVTTV